MSEDEVVVTVAAVLLGPVAWAWWLYRGARIEAFRNRQSATLPLALALIACAALTLGVLNVWASFDVVDAPAYIAMYVVLGLAWLRLVMIVFPFLGLSPHDDVIERGNRAALAAVIGALVAVTCCYAGGNVGSGPGWWVVLFAAGLATSALLVTWMILAMLTPIADAVTIDRDPAAGVRLGMLLIACGVIFGAGVAGDWESAGATVTEFASSLMPAAVLLVVAIAVERRARPTAARPRASMVARVGGAAETFHVNEDAGLARTDGGDAHTGAVRRSRVDVRTQVRRHPAARLQARPQRRAFLPEPAAAEPARGCRRRGHPSR